MHYRRGHWVKNPSRRNKKSSGWIVCAVIAVLAWAWIEGIGSSDQQGSKPSAPATVPASAP